MGEAQIGGQTRSQSQTVGQLAATACGPGYKESLNSQTEHRQADKQTDRELPSHVLQSHAMPMNDVNPFTADAVKAFTLCHTGLTHQF